MLIVTGMPRSGTSWIMQTLFYLRHPVFGIPNPPNRDPLMQPNNKPFWEFPSTLASDLSILGDSDCAVKVHLRKAIESVKLDPLKDKVILCKRDLQTIAQAQFDWNTGGGSVARCLKVTEQWYGRVEDWIGGTPLLQGDIAWARNNKAAAVNAIKNFIGSDQDITDAVGNIE